MVVMRTLKAANAFDYGVYAFLEYLRRVAEKWTGGAVLCGFGYAGKCFPCSL